MCVDRVYKNAFMCVKGTLHLPPSSSSDLAWPPASNSHSLITEICVPAKGIVEVSFVWEPSHHSSLGALYLLRCNGLCKKSVFEASEKGL